jgi:hypothetical protein
MLQKLFLGNSDLWPRDPKINRGRLSSMDNHPMKFNIVGRVES